LSIYPISQHPLLANELNSSLFCGEYWCICGKCVIKDLSLLIEDAEKLQQTVDNYTKEIWRLHQLEERLKKRIEELSVPDKKARWKPNPEFEALVIVLKEELQKILGDEK